MVEVGTEFSGGGYWVSVREISSSESGFVGGTSVSRITRDSKGPGRWPGPTIALFLFEGEEGELASYAISDACPHMAIGSLSKGDALSLRDCRGGRRRSGGHGGDDGGAAVADIEDAISAAVSCPVHSFTFDLSSGQCISDAPDMRTAPATVFPSRVVTTAGGGHAIQVFTLPRPLQPIESRVCSKAEGSAVQIAILDRALDAKFGRGD